MPRRSSTLSLALLATASLALGACLDEKKPPEPAGGAPAAGGSPVDPDVAMLRKSKPGEGWKDYFVLSPEDNQSDDPALSVKLVRIAKLRKNHVGIVLEFENHRAAALAPTDVTGSLVDGDDRSLPIVAKPAESVPSDASANLVWIFDTTNASKGSLEMRLDVPGSKMWPVVFSKSKPPDFKPTPNPGEGGAPQGPGPMGPGGY